MATRLLLFAATHQKQQNPLVFDRVGRSVRLMWILGEKLPCWMHSNHMNVDEEHGNSNYNGEGERACDFPGHGVAQAPAKRTHGQTGRRCS